MTKKELLSILTEIPDDYEIGMYTYFTRTRFQPLDTLSVNDKTKRLGVSFGDPIVIPLEEMTEADEL